MMVGQIGSKCMNTAVVVIRQIALIEDKKRRACIGSYFNF
jgi:hypothetical protein